eukprot:11647176-Alexandrium_andersonii.AAC.1
MFALAAFGFGSIRFAAIIVLRSGVAARGGPLCALRCGRRGRRHRGRLGVGGGRPRVIEIAHNRRGCRAVNLGRDADAIDDLVGVRAEL